MPLFSGIPRRLILGNRYSYARIAYSRRGQMQVNVCLLTDLPRRHQPPVAGCGEVPYACSASFLEEFFSEIGLPAPRYLNEPQNGQRCPYWGSGTGTGSVVPPFWGARVLVRCAQTLGSLCPRYGRGTGEVGHPKYQEAVVSSAYHRRSFMASTAEVARWMQGEKNGEGWRPPSDSCSARRPACLINVRTC